MDDENLERLWQLAERIATEATMSKPDWPSIAADAVELAELCSVAAAG